MKSVGEVMSIGRTFKEAIQKAVRSLEVDRYSLRDLDSIPVEKLPELLSRASHNRLFYLYRALQEGMSTEDIYGYTGIDPWFIDNLAQVAEMERRLEDFELHSIPDELLREAKRYGFSDVELGRMPVSYTHLRAHETRHD